jgi:hypothetical protein
MLGGTEVNLAGLTQAETKRVFGGANFLLVNFGECGALKQCRKSRGKDVDVVGDEIGMGWGKGGPAREEMGLVDKSRERVETGRIGGGN